MKIFRKGSDPPPYFWKLWNQWGTIQLWSPKWKNAEASKNTQNGYIWYKHFMKSAQKYPKPSIFIKNFITFKAQKCASKVWIGRDPPPPLRKNFITNPLFFPDGFPKAVTPESARFSQSQPESAWFCQSRPESVCNNLDYPSSNVFEEHRHTDTMTHWHTDSLSHRHTDIKTHRLTETQT